MLLRKNNEKCESLAQNGAKKKVIRYNKFIMTIFPLWFPTRQILSFDITDIAMKKKQKIWGGCDIYSNISLHYQ